MRLARLFTERTIVKMTTKIYFFLLPLCAAAVLSTICSATDSPTQAPPGVPLVPLPASLTFGAQTLALAPYAEFGLHVVVVQQESGGAGECATLETAFARIKEGIFQHARSGGGRPDTGNGESYAHESPAATFASQPILVGLIVTLQNSSEAPPQLGDDESYSLRIPAGPGPINASLSAATVSGALHGMQTFTKLALYNFDAELVQVPFAPWAIDDKPRFQHRGLMLDTARHFYPPRSILALLDAMASVKLNVFHWHLSDANSFPLLVPGTNLSAGAYTPSQRYSTADVQHIVEEARLRAIRVVPEFDMPAHTAPAWCQGHPEICTQGLLDPSQLSTYKVIEQLLTYAAQVFPDHVMHLGGDEIDLEAWGKDPKVAAYLAKQHPGLEPLAAAEAEAYSAFPARIGQLAQKQGRRITHWEDVFDWAAGGSAASVCGGVSPSLSNSTIVQVFRTGVGPGPLPGKVCGRNAAITTQVAVAAGYQVIWGPPSSWYLSCYSDKCGSNGGGAGFESWEAVYSAEPFFNENPAVNITDPVQQQRVLGGEVTVWSERLDPATMLSTAFPRAAAAAERLWSPRASNISAEIDFAEQRLNALRCHYLDRGIEVSSLANGNEAGVNGLPTRPSGPGGNC